MNPVIVITTCPKGQGEKLKRTIVENKLGACASSFSVSSSYWWKGEIVSEEEDLLIIKTIEEKLKDLYEVFRSEHPYTVPEFLVIPVKILGPYYDWLKETLSNE